MSLHYILDGYNIIRHPDFISVKKIKDARVGLLRFITDKKPCGSSNNKVTVVFDGSGDLDTARVSNKRIEVLFTGFFPAAGAEAFHSNADDKIKKLVRDSKNPRIIVVVSDDREIQFFIKSYGARSMSAAEFINKGVAIPKPQKDLPKIGLSYSQTAKINKELEDLWLK